MPYLNCILGALLLLIACRPTHSPNRQASIAQVKLGQYLFYDTRLSANNTKACATCHAPELAFSDAYRRSSGLYADPTRHNAPSLLNIDSRSSLNWAEPHLHSLAEQMLRPLFATNPSEMGAKGYENIIYERLKADTLYTKLFQQAYPAQNNPIHFDHIISAIAQFLRTLKMPAALNNYANCDHISNTQQKQLAQQGYQLFFSERLNCFACHNGTNLDQPMQGETFANIGLYNCNNAYPADDFGIAEKTNQAHDNGKFRIPSLRNVALTAPYFHDGSTATLSEVIDMYQNGGRNMDYGNCMGNGKQNPNKDKRLRTFTLTPSEKQQLIAFLHSLTDTSFLQNPNFTNPFEKKQP
jgi:cytochrome c peroxidase